MITGIRSEVQFRNIFGELPIKASTDRRSMKIVQRTEFNSKPTSEMKMKENKLYN